jgi:hypothetical protein
MKQRSDSDSGMFLHPENLDNSASLLENGDPSHPLNGDPSHPLNGDPSLPLNSLDSAGQRSSRSRSANTGKSGRSAAVPPNAVPLEIRLLERPFKTKILEAKAEGSEIFLGNGSRPTSQSPRKKRRRKSQLLTAPPPPPPRKPKTSRLSRDIAVFDANGTDFSPKRKRLSGPDKQSRRKSLRRSPPSVRYFLRSPSGVPENTISSPANHLSDSIELPRRKIAVAFVSK